MDEISIGYVLRFLCGIGQGQRTDKPAFFARTLYKARARIEQGVGRIKRFKCVALRCEKTARNFKSIVAFAAGLCLIKFIHAA